MRLALLCLLLSVSAFAEVRRQVFSFGFDGGTRWLKVESLRDDLLHFELYETRGKDHEKLGPSKDDAIWSSPMVDQANYGLFKGPVEYKEHDDGIETKEIRATFSKDLRHVRYYDKLRGIDLTTLRSEKLNEPIKTMHIEKLAMKNVYGVGNLFTNNQSADGDWVGKKWNQRGHGNFRFGLDFGDDFDRGGPSISQFPMIFVLGDRLRSGDFANYGLMFDQVYKMSWNFEDVKFEESTGWTASGWGDQVRWFFMTGPNLRDVRSDYMRLVGTPQVPPKTVFGHWTSEFGYDNWKELEDDVKSLRKNDFPLEGVALDIQWFGGTFGEPHANKMGSLEFNKTNFPDPKEKIKWFLDHYGISFMPIEESYIDAKLDDFKALANHEYRKGTVGFNHFAGEKYEACYLARHNVFYDKENKNWYPVFVTTNYKNAGDADTKNWWGGGGMVDWSSPGARRFWHQLKRVHLSKMGIFSHWLDLGEPEMYFENAHYHGFPELKKTDHGTIHNLYNLFWAQGIREGYERAENKVDLIKAASDYYGFKFEATPRYFSMSRAGTIGSHRYTAMWSGDVFSNMGNLRGHLHTQKDMSLLGIDYYSSDTGGFFHDGRAEDDLKDREIVTQWAAVSSLLDTPMRPHGWAMEEDKSGNKRFTLDARGDLDSNRANVRRRYELIPYTYSLAHMASRNGEPIFPPLVYHFQDDTNVRTLGNVKMIGPWLLFGVVATEGEKSRKVYLPRGAWVDYESNEWHYSTGGESKEIGLYRQERVPAAELKDKPDKHFFMAPLFAREGALIPRMFVDDKTMNVMGRRKDDSTRDELIVRAFVSPHETSFMLYEDDGLSTAYKTGEVRETRLMQKLEGDRASVIVEASKGNFARASDKRETVIELVTDKRTAARAELNGAACGTLAEFTAGKHTCWFHPGPTLIRAGTRKESLTKAKAFTFTLAR